MADMFKIGFEADVKAVKEVDKALDGMAGAADNADEQLDGLNDEMIRNAKLAPKVASSNGKATVAVKQGAKAFKLQKGAIQQTGYQIQDFSVQMAGGTSFMTAFGQQASQLAGVLGPGGAVIGAVIAVGAAIGGVLLKTLFNATEGIDELSEKVNTLRESFIDLDSIELTESQGNLSEYLEDAQEVLEDATDDLTKAIKKNNKKLDKETKDLLFFQNKKNDLELKIELRSDISNFDKLGMKTGIGLGDDLLELESEINDILDDQAKRQKKINIAKADVYRASQLVASVEKTIESTLARQDELQNGTVEALKERQRLTAQILEDGKKSVEGQDGNSQFSDAVMKAEQDAIRSTTDARFKAIKAQEIANAQAVAIEETKNQRLLDSQNTLFMKQYDSLVFSNLSQEEQLKQSYKNKQASLEQFAKTQENFDATKREMELVLYADYLAKMRALENGSIQEQTNNLANYINNVDQFASIFGNLQSATTAQRKADLEEDLRNSENFTDEQIANKTKEAKAIFEAQQKADLASIASSTSVAMMTQAAQGNWLGVAAAFALGTKQYASASAQSYGGSSSPAGGGVTAPPSQNNTTNNSGGNIVNIDIVNSNGGTVDIDSIKEYFNNDGVLFDSNTAQAEALR